MSTIYGVYETVPTFLLRTLLMAECKGAELAHIATNNLLVVLCLGAAQEVHYPANQSRRHRPPSATHFGRDLPEDLQNFQSIHVLLHLLQAHSECSVLRDDRSIKQFRLFLHILHFGRSIRLVTDLQGSGLFDDTIGGTTVRTDRLLLAGSEYSLQCRLSLQGLEVFASESSKVGGPFLR